MNVKSLLCLIMGGHDYRVVQGFDTSMRRLVCDRCGRDWIMYDKIKVMVPWSKSIEEALTNKGTRIIKP